MIKLLDLCCKAGGCSVGYHQAAKEIGVQIDITGVDIVDQPNYPYRFIKADAIEYLKVHWKEYTHIHASPPCQGYSRTKSLHSKKYPKLIEPLRFELLKTGKPYIIENVPGAPLLKTVVLDGTMFDLRVVRKRIFESNILIEQHKKGMKKGTVGGKNSNRATLGYYFIVGGHQTGTLQEWRDAMAIDWMTKPELAEAIPPPYTKYIGKYFFSNIKNKIQ